MMSLGLAQMIIQKNYLPTEYSAKERIKLFMDKSFLFVIVPRNVTKNEQINGNKTQTDMDSFANLIRYSTNRKQTSLFTWQIFTKFHKCCYSISK